MLDLAAADGKGVRPLRGRDPTHSSLLRATRCQQARLGTPSERVVTRLRRLWLPTWKAALRREGTKYDGTQTGKSLDSWGLDPELFGFHFGAATEVGGPNGVISAGYGEGVAIDVLGTTVLPRRRLRHISRQWGSVVGLVRWGSLFGAIVCALILGIPALSPIAQVVHASIVLPILNLSWLGTYLIVWIDASRVDQSNVQIQYRERILGENETELRNFHPNVAVIASNASSLRWLSPRINSVRALGHLGSAAAEAIPTLRRLLRDENQVMRAEAARALGQIGPAAISTAAELRSYLEQISSAGRPAEAQAAIAAAIVSVEG